MMFGNLTPFGRDSRESSVLLTIILKNAAGNDFYGQINSARFLISCLAAMCETLRRHFKAS